MSPFAFRIDLAIYAGPIDLLLYLIRREELTADQIQLSRIIEQYQAFLRGLEEIGQYAELDVDEVADFIETAAILIEIKSQAVLPREEASIDDDTLEFDVSDQGLASRLLHYKRFRDVAHILDEQSQQWHLRVARQGTDFQSKRVELSEQPIADAQIWDLVSAFGRIMKANQPLAAEEVIYDDTPIHEHMKSIHARVKKERRVDLQGLFDYRFHKSKLIAMFLAALELTRHHGVRAIQDERTATIWLTPGDHFANQLETAEVDLVDNAALSEGTFGFRAR